jgi:hypothetical protein
LKQQGTLLLYIGIAKGSLFRRLVEQDLRHTGPSTFFRGLGAILGYRPQIGSLTRVSNKNNYKFNGADTDSIRRWINAHLSICWHEASPALLENETVAIGKYRPVLNTKHNPHAMTELAVLREECRRIARSVSTELRARQIRRSATVGEEDT